MHLLPVSELLPPDVGQDATERHIAGILPTLLEVGQEGADTLQEERGHRDCWILNAVTVALHRGCRYCRGCTACLIHWQLVCTSITLAAGKVQHLSVSMRGWMSYSFFCGTGRRIRRAVH